MKDLKIRWALHGPETEPTARQRGMLIYRHLQSLGYDADAWDLQESADIIVCQYDLKHLDNALATGAVVVQDVNDQVFAEHHAWHQRFVDNIHKAHAVVAGTDRLAQHLTRMHPFVRVIQEPVDDRYLAVKPKKHRGMNLIFMGMHDNVSYLTEVDNVLERLAYSHEFTVNFVIPKKDGFGNSNKSKVDAKPYSTSFHEWDMDTLLSQMAVADIGLVPLFHNGWTMCKSNNKLMSFCAAGIPSVASDLQQYRSSIRHGYDGFVATSEDDWQDAISSLLTNVAQRRKIGSNAHINASRWATNVISAQWEKLFQEIRYT